MTHKLAIDKAKMTCIRIISPILQSSLPSMIYPYCYLNDTVLEME